MRFSSLFYLSLITLPALGSILPKNNLKIPVGSKFSSGGLSFAQFNAVIDKVESTYVNVVRAQGGNLVILRKWDDPTVNAGTYREEGNNNWYVNLYGGYARHPLITEDGFTLVACHELGHHIGGAPKKDPNYNPPWSGTEGQADYFATLKCLRKVFAKDNNRSIIQKLKVPGNIQSQCQKAFSDKNDMAICIRTSVAGISVAAVMSDTLDLPEASPDSKDESVSSYTMDRHPTPQCRLDTYIQGSICKVSSWWTVSQTEPAKGTCDVKNGFVDGVRPLCWYKP